MALERFESMVHVSGCAGKGLSDEVNDETGYRILITFLFSILNDSGSGRERDFFDGSNDAEDDVCKCSEDVDVEEDDVWYCGVGRSKKKSSFFSFLRFISHA